MLPPRFSGHIIGSPCAPHTFEVFLDYTCPYSARFHFKFIHEVLPWLKKNYPGQVQYVLCNQVQSWRPQATNMHEASLAVEKIHPDAFQEYSVNLFTNQKAFMDEEVCEMSRNEIYERLAEYLPSGVDKNKFLELLVIAKGEGKGKGNPVTDDVKWWLKYARGRGIHVSPTVLWDGIKEPGMDSQTSVEDWKVWFTKRLEETSR